jgi:Fic family protein
MELLVPDHLPAYRAQRAIALDEALAEVREAVNGGTGQLLRLYESAVFSSQIEGSKVTLNLFKQTMEAAGSKPRPRDVQEVYDLVLAYQFAQEHTLGTANLLEAHRILAALLVNANDQGAWRTKGVKVGNAFVTVYMAPHQSLVPGLMDQLMREVDALLLRELTLDEVFYYAAMLHLAFAKIHPFVDGNGRTARLLEKWFLAHHLGPVAWSLRSEQVYIRNLDQYYDTLAALGPDWGNLQWDQCVPFLLMLPEALRNK